jgi:hypothetical protein
MIISRTPSRISFLGGRTDDPARYLPPFFEHRFRIVYTKNENCRTIGEIDSDAEDARIADAVRPFRERSDKPSPFST